MTSFTAELIAIKEAYKICINQKELNYVIFTDYQSIVKTLKYNVHNFAEHYIISDIIAMNSEALKSGKNIILCWIKAHIGIKNNEIVDNLAKKSTMKESALPTYQLPMGDIIAIIRSIKRTKWQEQYNNSDKGKYYKKIHPTLPIKTWFNQVSNRGFIKTICRIRSNHCLTPVYKREIGLVDNDECLCGELADLQHTYLCC
uniref:Uncharacterized protein LOC114333026 n=1 Tax=Diabrotica virgifera virgifera TaxID=50390 RepID=A0A6P7G0N9_DIAVI